MMSDKRAPLTPSSEAVVQDLYEHVIKSADAANGGTLTVGHVVDALGDEGILFWRDARFAKSQNVALCMAQQSLPESAHKSTNEAQKAASVACLNFDGFVQFISPCASLFHKAFSENLVIPDWSTFTTDLVYHFHEAEKNTGGLNAQYIPILRDADSDKWGLSVCSVDGQRFSIGDVLIRHTLQSTSKPVTYALGLAREGEDYMEEWIDVEPAGRPFNTQDLDPGSQRPFNASVNSGAIMAAGVFASAFPDDTWREIVEKVQATWFELCGNEQELSLSEETFQSEKATAYNNFAISYNLKGRRGLPRDVDVIKMLDVYLGCCSTEITTEALAVAAATLANGGVCPITDKEVFPADVTRVVLSETMTCGMYDQAGRFAVEVGLPAKSGVSGALMVIIPNVLGFATFSPRLNQKGNSVRGTEFCSRLVRCYRLHLFEPLGSGNTGAKIDPRTNSRKQKQVQFSSMAWAAEVGCTTATKVRDIFLLALCQVASVSREGLSERMLERISSHYSQHFQTPMEDGHFQAMLSAVKQHAGEMQLLKDLTQDLNMPDSIRSMFAMAMLDFIVDFEDGEVGIKEKDRFVQILALLGVSEEVALMKLHRYTFRANA